MDKETGSEYHVWKSRKDCDSMNYDEIKASMIAEAEKDKYRPYDLNWKGSPNIYLRGKYEIADDGQARLIDDGFIMFVEEAV